MGRKSKKSMANKLAKMSDEERAKYMQRKADAEEEIKRRREQLIATFIKNKLKKEEGYGRLNLAKINQHWHQLLRKQKCKQMKEEVGHLKKWIGRVYKLKAKTINNLTDELEEAESQLQNNFQAHVIRIDELIGKHREYLKKIHNQYEKDRNELMETFLTEKRNIMGKSLESTEFLKSLVYGNDEKLEIMMKENKEKHIEKLTIIMADYHIEHEEMEKELKSICYSVVKQLSNITKKNFKETDPKRIHYQGLLKFDRESMIIIKNQFECIQQKEDFLKRIEKRYSELKEARQKRLQEDQSQFNFLKDCLFIMRKRMLSDIKLDEKRRIILIDCSCKIIKFLESVAYKGQQILQLTQTCKNLETQSDKISRWHYLFRQEQTKNNFAKKEDSYNDNDDLYEDSEIETKREVFNEDECYFRRVKMLHSPFHKTESSLDELNLNISENTRMSPSSIKSDYISSTSQSTSFNFDPINKIDEATIIKQDLLVSTQSYSDTIRTFSDSKSIFKRSKSITHATLNRPKFVHPKKPSSAPASLINRKATEANNKKKNYKTSPSVIRVLDEFKSLEGMENFWTTYNKIEIEYIHFKNEKFILLEENKQLKNKLRLLFQTREISSLTTSSVRQ